MRRFNLNLFKKISSFGLISFFIVPISILSLTTIYSNSQLVTIEQQNSKNSLNEIYLIPNWIDIENDTCYTDIDNPARPEDWTRLQETRGESINGEVMGGMYFITANSAYNAGLISTNPNEFPDIYEFLDWFEDDDWVNTVMPLFTSLNEIKKNFNITYSTQFEGTSQQGTYYNIAHNSYTSTFSNFMWSFNTNQWYFYGYINALSSSVLEEQQALNALWFDPIENPITSNLTLTIENIQYKTINDDIWKNVTTVIYSMNSDVYGDIFDDFSKMDDGIVDIQFALEEYGIKAKFTVSFYDHGTWIFDTCERNNIKKNMIINSTSTSGISTIDSSTIDQGLPVWAWILISLSIILVILLTIFIVNKKRKNVIKNEKQI